MEVKLICVGGKHAGQQVPIAGSKFLIGRAEDCHLRPSSKLVSLHHAVILVEEGFVAIRDFASKNGTYVNGQRIKAKRRLKTGEHLKIGPLEFEVHLAVHVGGKRRPKIHSVREAAARAVEAVQSSDVDDLDVSDWLRDEQDSLAKNQTAGNQPLSATSNAEPGLSHMTTIAGEQLEQMPKARQKKEKKPPIAGRFENPKKPAAESTSAAAADTLHQFFGGKR
jgi:pSer/pThr/pTyr-binding forkhead associated (FHA) protein